MIKSLYKTFQHWSEKGSVYIISDTHFDDPDCKLMNPSWIDVDTQIDRINRIVHKTDTLIHLGDVGNPVYMSKVKAYKVLIMGNHDKGASVYEPYFDEVYEGSLQIGQKILLSHEPVYMMAYGHNPIMNLHGHEHGSKFDLYEDGRNFCADVIDYTPISLGKLIKEGLLKNVKDIHDITIHNEEKLKFMKEHERK